MNYLTRTRIANPWRFDKRGGTKQILRWKQGGIDKAGMWRPADVADDLSQGAFETAGGFLQLALQSFHLLRYILKLSLGKPSSLGNLVGGAIRSAHRGPDFHRDSRESASPGHRCPPLGTHAILYHNPDYAILFPKNLRRQTGQIFWRQRKASACRGVFVEELSVREGGAVHAPELGAFRLDEIILVRSVHTTAMAEPEVSRGQAQRLAGEHVSGPRACEARQKHRVDSVTAIDSGRRADHSRIGRRARGIVSAAHARFNISESFLGEVGLHRGERFRRGHVGNE